MENPNLNFYFHLYIFNYILTQHLGLSIQYMTQIWVEPTQHFFRVNYLKKKDN